MVSKCEKSFLLAVIIAIFSQGNGQGCPPTVDLSDVLNLLDNAVSNIARVLPIDLGGLRLGDLQLRRGVISLRGLNQMTPVETRCDGDSVSTGVLLGGNAPLQVDAATPNGNSLIGGNLGGLRVRLTAQQQGTRSPSISGLDVNPGRVSWNSNAGLLDGLLGPLLGGLNLGPLLQNTLGGLLNTGK